MRATRLLSILITLQARGRATAQTLAEDCEVSVRTIYRDIDALSAAGVPVYAERGSAGGYRLLDGYRTRLNGLSRDEVEALFLSGLSGSAGALGLETALAAAQLKVTAGLPPELRAAADRMRALFLLDAPGWFHSPEAPADLQRLAAAIREERAIQIRYRSWRTEEQRRIEPVGLVLKSGAWYLVALAGAKVRTFRIARMSDLEVLEQRFRRPPGFDLAVYWRDSTRQLEEELHPTRALVRLTALGYAMLEPLTTPFVRAGAVIGEADAEGRRVVLLPVGSPRQACSELLRFGAEAEVLAPADLRRKMAELIRTLEGLYSGSAEGAPLLNRPS